MTLCGVENNEYNCPKDWDVCCCECDDRNQCGYACPSAENVCMDEAVCSLQIKDGN